MILTMVFNICIDLKIYLVSYFTRKEIAVLDNIKLARDENQPDSEDFKRGHLTDQYVSKSGRRYDFSIREATNETLCAVSLQVITFHKSLASYTYKRPLDSYACPDQSRGKRAKSTNIYKCNLFSKTTCNFLGKGAACSISCLNRPQKAPFLWPHHSYMLTWIKLETTYKPP